MRSGAAAPLALSESETGFALFLRRQIGRLIGVCVFGAVAFGLASLGTWNVADPSLSHATDNPVTNAMGFPGAAFADLAMQFYGLSAVAVLAPAVIWGILFLSARRIDRKVRRAVAWFGASLLTAGIAGCVTPPETWPLPSGLGGVFGDMMLKIPALVIGGYPKGTVAWGIAAALAVPALGLAAFGSGLLFRRELVAEESRPSRDALDDDIFEDEEEAEGILALGVLAHWWLSARALVRRKLGGIRIAREDEYDLPAPSRGWREAAERVETAERAEARVSSAGRARVEPEFFAAMVAERAPAMQPELEDDDLDLDDVEPLVPASKRGPTEVRHYRSLPSGAPVAPTMSKRVEEPAPRPVPSARSGRVPPSHDGDHDFEMPALHFLAEPKTIGRDPSLSKDALEQNARMLEGVLEDFGVKGEIIHVRPGPVVTLYELEPAPGIKSSRVIGLADDIARSMSAIACRVAVVPGRNAIGIELPNPKRETVYLREILASQDFEQTKAKLALALGKTINGEAVVVDIAKMPHVLVAGTTGSGKSVAINTMILSLLYRMTPQECRLIMIDPKMLELSVYDGIPHLLTPVVTDPKKAVVALKWTVREMEDRYRKMSKVGVRNIDGFNARVMQAEKKGERITRTVQTGFDRETGEAIYETEEMDLAPLPYIVVIIDEMADLMMVAGKDIEGAVQRLAQMARAAGIHVIMATQRPSVDVITGTIKANFPTRISFQVTSKIDSRTILGEQGAEQLLGMGDMLYMAGGGRIQRVHGPFVSDDEVEKVVNHLKLQGVPEYLDAITEDEDGEDEGDGPRGGGSSGSGGGNFEDSEDPYDQAVAVVLRDGKASTSYIQRRLGIGYNRAASIIERMEKEGIVGPANHAGKREILVPTEEDNM
ncbi:DNA translocase FtsK [Pseudaminobacter sp. 19-2017]|uniref:DNA translocase FtsK n=1 Tax=Pseudaminobacter soli (ex Zhang et al. 2022) TaxID=2831468 RepID=A0A942DZ33_9HYPH|nr:DNA translocase FtsK [Pseudaminobacter soli]MBS3647710.1 DNA translocase FtsK [Pseudaminobacter soli]